jgi:hypothetical protein
MIDSRYVKIIKCTFPTFWYSNDIGSVFKYLGGNSNDVHVARNTGLPDGPGYDVAIYHVKRDDCVFLDEYRQQQLSKLDL